MSTPRSSTHLAGNEPHAHPPGLINGGLQERSARAAAQECTVVSERVFVCGACGGWKASGETDTALTTRTPEFVCTSHPTQSEFPFSVSSIAFAIHRLFTCCPTSFL